jgi:hypothetical protein
LLLSFPFCSELPLTEDDGAAVANGVRCQFKENGPLAHCKQRIRRRQLFVVVFTQEEVVAKKLCSMNNGQIIAPVPTTYTGEPPLPQWKSMQSA